MKKVLLIFVLCFLFVGCFNKEQKDGTVQEDSKTEDQANDNDNTLDTDNKDNNDIIIEGSKPINRAMTAKMLALANFSKMEISQYDREINYKDTNPEHWFDDYINIVSIHKWFPETKDNFRPYDLLTYNDIKYIIQEFNLEENNLSIDLPDDLSQPIAFEEWFEIYKMILNENDLDNEVVSEEFVLVGTPANINSLNSWELVTDKGKYGFEGLAMDQYIDKKIKVIKRGSEIISVVSIVEENPVITNVWVKKASDSLITVFVGGAYRDYQLDVTIEDSVSNKIADISIMNNKVADYLLKEDSIRGKVLRINDNEVLIEGLGFYSIADDKKIYSNYNDLQWKQINQIIVGYDSAEFILQEGEVCAAIITEPVNIDNIRVLLKTTGFDALTHNRVEINSNDDFTVVYGEDEMLYEQGESIIVDMEHPMLQEEDYIRVVPSSGSKLEVSSIDRAYGVPSYRGILEITKGNEGVYIINELPFEEYLYSVVPSEMPTSYGLEASKVQAICARSYAYSQFYANSYSKHGAHVDDSVSSQVYNNYEENDTSIKAVTETSKLGLKYNGSVISAFFYSTSSGYSASSGDVWAKWDTKEFPASTPEYLIGKPQFEDNLSLDLSKEEDFAKFIKNDKFNAYDKDLSWHRWEVAMTKEQLSKSIQNYLEERYLVAPKLIKVLGDDDKFRSRPIESIGELKDIKVYNRGESGIITEILIIGTQRTYKVATEYNLRHILAPKKYSQDEEDIILTRKDGSTLKNLNSLPSAFFTMEKNIDDNEELKSITFYGGGYGHGVGMSQNGVKGMVDRGYNYEKILKHFYTNVDIKEIY
ncbi:MAG: SpoIID/LytB domain-containing protein [Eubacteriales bacterium]